MLTYQLNITNSIVLLIVLALLIGGNTTISIVFVLLLLITTIILTIFKNSYKSLLTSIFLVILVGISLIIKNEFYMSSTFTQIKISISYAMYSICTFLIWFNTHIANTENEKMIFLKNELERYSEKEGANKILTRNEFNYKKKFILKGASIRNEAVVFVSIELKKYNKPQSMAVLYKIGDILGEMLRDEYDIYTLDKYQIYHVILQNTDIESALQFKNNLLKNIKSKMDIKDKYIDIVIDEIKERKNSEIILK